MNWWVIIGALLGGVLVSALAVAGSIRVADRFGVLDHPDGGRKNQDRPIPKLGGLAVAVAFTLVGFITLQFVELPGEAQLAAAVLLPALLAGVVGYVDDRIHINPYLRIVLQAAVGFLIWVLGSRVDVFGVDWLDAFIVIVFVIVLINGLNLLDNSDGLAASTVVVAGLGASGIALLFQQELVSILGFAIVGVSLGFLWHNWFPARVYMGDSGAYFLATLLAVLIIRLRPESVDPLLGVAIALLLVVLPLTDTTYVVIKRIRSGIHPFTAGRDHLSHGLQERGMSVPGSVGVLQLVSVVGALAAVAIALLMGGIEL